MTEMKTLTIGDKTYQVNDEVARALLQNLADLSYETDPDGNKILKVVDAAPFAYDPSLEALRTVPVATSKIGYTKIGYTSQVLETTKSVSFELRPPVGKVWRIKMASFLIDISANSPTSGTHTITARYYINDMNHNVLTGTANHDKRILYSCGEFAEHMTSVSPTDKANQSNALKDLPISYDFPLFVNYQNRTDVDVTFKPIIVFAYTEEDEII